MSAVPDSIVRRDEAPAIQYDAIAAAYRRTTRSPIRRFVEAYTLFQILGDVGGRSVLDLACGEGFYSRQLRLCGASRVVGVDISPAMIALACEQDCAAPGIEYRVGDARDLPDLGAFDVVCAAYLLHYARDVGELARMCRGIARQLQPGGRFVAINENPEQSEERYSGYLRYGFGKSVASPRREGSPISYAMISGRELFRFEAYHFEPTTYERELAAAGFVDLRWHPVRLDPEGVTAMGADYWAEYMDNPPVVGLACRLPG